jgi:hypothetical protein
VVPAAAVFRVAFGIALIGVENKQSLLDILAATSKTLTKVEQKKGRWSIGRDLFGLWE